MEFATLGPDFTDRELKGLPFLQCVVEETLRLAAPIPAALPRVVPPGGASLDGYWLPGGSIVSTVPWSVHRMDSIFPDARRFIPSRWENPTKDMKDGFLAFGGGVRSQLTLMPHELSLDLVLLIFMSFRFSLCRYASLAH